MLLSIISISYNNAAGLKATCLSLSELKALPQVEWLVIDGGSADNTDEIIKICKPDNYISEKDNGIYDAMNKGLNMATGKYVWFLNAGDTMNNQLGAHKLLNYLSEDKDLLYSETLLTLNGKILGTRSSLTTRKLPESINRNIWLKGMVIGHQAMIVKKKLAPEYNLKLRHVADYDWAISVTTNTITYIKSEIALACFDSSGHSDLYRRQSNLQRFKVMQMHYGLAKTILAHLRILFVALTHKILQKS